MNQKRKIQRLTMAAFFVALEVVMAVTPIGYIRIGVINITTMHLPVILAGMLLGERDGALLGFVFGLTSMLKATFVPNLTSFCFSPFVTIGGVHGNFASLLIAFGPRIFLGWNAGMLYRLLHRITHHKSLSFALSAGINTLVHTLFVMGLIWVFFGQAYAAAAGISVGAVIITVLTSNGIFEILIATILIPTLLRMLAPMTQKMGI